MATDFPGDTNLWLSHADSHVPAPTALGVFSGAFDFLFYDKTDEED